MKILNSQYCKYLKTKTSRAVTKYDLIPPPALRQKQVFCTQTDTQTHAWTDG